MTSSALANDIRAYGQFMADGTARSLRLLREIDDTKALLHTIADVANSFCRIIADLTAGIGRMCEPLPEDDLVASYNAAQDHVSDLHNALREMQAANGAALLRPSDNVDESYQLALKGVTDLYDCIETFRWRVLEHGADHDPASGPVLTTPEAIERYLAAL